MKEALNIINPPPPLKNIYPLKFSLEYKNLVWINNDVRHENVLRHFSCISNIPKQK
jgi:hypothetical protein